MTRRYVASWKSKTLVPSRQFELPTGLTVWKQQHSKKRQEDQKLRRMVYFFGDYLRPSESRVSRPPTPRKDPTNLRYIPICQKQVGEETEAKNPGENVVFSGHHVYAARCEYGAIFPGLSVKDRKAAGTPSETAKLLATSSSFARNTHLGSRAADNISRQNVVSPRDLLWQLRVKAGLCTKNFDKPEPIPRRVVTPNPTPTSCVSHQWGGETAHWREEKQERHTLKSNFA